MKANEISKYKCMSNGLVLNDWVENGVSVTVDVYLDEKTNNCYQVQTNGKRSKFRETGPCTPNEIKSYGEWKRLEE